jgi:hypothetical protein
MRSLALCALAAAALLLPPRAHAAELPWNQERVIALAAQLVGEAGELYDEVFRQPIPAGVPSQRREYFRLKREVRHLRNEARHFARAAEDGQGQEETAASFEALLSSARWAEQRSRSVFTVREVQERARNVHVLLRELARFYDDPGPLPEPYAR